MSLKEKIIIISGVVIFIIGLTVAFVNIGDIYFAMDDRPTEEEVIVVAENWIRNYSSFSPFGIGLSLQESKYLGDETYELKFSFIYEDPEYGNQEREVVVKVEEREVIEVIRDNNFDEKKGEYINDLQK